ncbi:MAG TPA: hypothetical protein VFY29_02870 [Terriglobia bacterium]|nr:hypothetical protein [Terriglobia bacterium]
MRAVGVTAIGVFFAAGALMSSVSAVSLLAPGSFLEPIWSLNPRARETFAGMGDWAVLLLLTVSLTCLSAAAGFLLRRRWGHRLGVALFAANLVGSVVNVATGNEPKAIWGIPVVLALLIYLLRPNIRRQFSSPQL